jgi:hypothetical protein
MTDTRRGYHPDDTTHEADYFGNCSVCGAAIDTREPRQLLAHLHGAEIEIGVGRPFAPKSASHRGVCQCEALGASLDESIVSI